MLNYYRNKFIVVQFIGLICLINQATTYAHQNYIQVPSVIHVHSDFSDGKHPIEEIAQTAQRKGIRSVIFADHALMRWEYGLWPLRNILKKRVDKNSVLKFGAKKYFQEIEEIQEKYPGILFLTGVESAPFYYWSGKHFKYHLTLHNWHKHMLITGLKDSKDYENLPLVSSSNAGEYSWKSIFLFWPIGLFAVGCWLLAKKRQRQILFGQQVFLVHSRFPRLVGTLFVLAGLIFLVNNYPYKYFPYDQYHGDKGVGPYQNLIQYVNAKGGVIFWAHPEAPNWEKPQEINGITLQTPTYAGDLLKTKDYTGYAILYEGFKKVGTPGGIWDQILKQYCNGIREKPVWALGELDYKAEGYLGTYLDSIQNILLIPTNLHESKQVSRMNPVRNFQSNTLMKIPLRKNQNSSKISNGVNTNTKEVLDCLQKGRFYVLQKAKSDILRLEGFRVEAEGKEVTIGEEISYSKPPKIKIEIKIKNELAKVLTPVRIKLIRGGEIIKIFEENFPINIEYIDYDLPTGKTYYRLEISGADCGIITNPIFVTK